MPQSTVGETQTAYRPMLLRRFYYDKLAQASYMIGCQATKEAIVIDPHRDAELYVEAAQEEGLRIRYVTETHIHADYLSGSRQLARRAGAELLLSGEGDEMWQYAFGDEEGARIIHGQDRIELGNVLIEVLHTPGHTPEHLSFLITDRATSSHPMAVMTGDFVFVGDVGRPDLLEKAAGFTDTMEASARDLFRSLERLRELPGHLQILPGHGAGSACGKALGAVPTSTLGYEILVNWAFQCDTEGEFVQQVLEDQPEPPVYFAKMKQLNRDGPPVLDGLPKPARMDAQDVGSVLAGDAVVVDTRPAADFARGHVPGTLSVPLAEDFPGTCGWLVPYDRPIYLVSRGGEEAAEAARDLAFIGSDAVEGYFDAEMLAYWTASHGPLQTTVEVDWHDVERARSEGGAVIVDVRGLTDWRGGHVPDARHAHLGSLRERSAELPRDRPVFVYCQAGKRSAVASAVSAGGGLRGRPKRPRGHLGASRIGSAGRFGVTPCAHLPPGPGASYIEAPKAGPSQTGCTREPCLNQT